MDVDLDVEAVALYCVVLMVFILVFSFLFRCFGRACSISIGLFR